MPENTPAIAPETLTSANVPQADRPEQLLALARHISEHGEQDWPPEFSDQRHRSYYRQALELLGAFDKAGKPTPLLASLAQTTEDAREGFTTAFAQTPLAQAWMRWQGVPTLAELDPQRAVAFLQACTDMAESTGKRRATTLRRWLEWSFGKREAPRVQLSLNLDNPPTKAVVCTTVWHVGGSKAEGRKMTKQNHKLMMRAFNGECDAALAKVRWDNIVKMEERVRRAADAINKAAEVNQSYIAEEYIDLKIKELRLSYEYQEKIKEQREEQRRIQEEMREEERARRELEKARDTAQKEEARYQQALKKAREELQQSHGAQHDKLLEQIANLESALEQAQAIKERAISQAQLTKAGHVYVISNVGSFGENVFKIGMTRRLEPLDRVRELGDASVPFEFDVHAMVWSENAPELERRMHLEFASRRVNLVNPRKEFFEVSLAEIEAWASSQGFDLQLTKIAEARDYRQSCELRGQGAAAAAGAALAEQELGADEGLEDERVVEYARS